MTTAKKAASDSIVDEDALVEQIARDIRPSSETSPAPTSSVERQGVKAMPAHASEAQNGMPSKGPSADVGMTAVVDNSVAKVGDETVRMVNADGHEVDVVGDDVKMHERSGWKRLNKEDEA